MTWKPSEWPDGFAEGIDTFFDQEGSRTPGLNLYPEVFDSMLFPLQRKNELEQMMRLVRQTIPRPKAVMEIGADKGGGFYHWVKGFTSVSKAIACELRGCPYAERMQKAFPCTSLLCLKGSSRASSNISKVLAFLGDTRLDVLFIDGDKARMRQDFDTYRRFMAKGSVVLLHDIVEGEPRKAFRSLTKEYRTAVIHDVSEGREALMRKQRGDKMLDRHDSWQRHWGTSSCGVGVVYMP